MKICLLVLDVDGTLTDGNIFYGDNFTEHKAFAIKDGAILKSLPHLGVEVIFLTGRKSEAVKRRAADLGALAIQDVEDKMAVLSRLLIERNLNPEQCAYIGDDINDYNAMNLCGFKACPSDAAMEIRNICDYVSPIKGGYGAVRDICEKILKQENMFYKFLAYYGIE